MSNNLQNKKEQNLYISNDIQRSNLYLNPCNCDLSSKETDDRLMNSKQSSIASE